MSTRSLGQCLVCDDNAVGINFAVPTCAACKAFFRRNAVKLGRRDFVCREDGDCLVNFKSRRFCNCCRLAKCFRVGMQKALIRSEAERQARKQLVEQNRQKRVRHLPIKTSDMIRPANLLLSSSNPFQHMSSIDQTLLTNILGAYERTCIATKLNQSPAFPVCKHSSIHAFLSEYSERQKSLVKYFKILPEFEHLCINDKIRLIRNNFSMTLSINEATLSTNISQYLIDCVSMLYTANLSAQLIQCIKILHSYTHDRTLLKLLLTIQSFTSGIIRGIYDIEIDGAYDSRAIFAAQNVYVDLLWKYLLTRFPTEYDVIRFYNQIIRDLLFVQRVTLVADSFMLNHSSEIRQMEPLIKTMWETSDNGDNAE